MSTLDRWTHAIIHSRFVVLACWLVVMAVGSFSAVHLPLLLSTSLAVPGTSSQQADALLARHFAENPDGTFTVVFRSGKTSAQTVHALTRRMALAARVLPAAHTTPLQTGAGIAYGNVVTALDLQHAQRYTDALRRVLARQGPPGAYVTGLPAIQHDINPVLAADLRKGELIAVPLALLVLAWVLGVRAILLVPLVFAAGTITAALAIVYALAHVILMVSYVPNLVELLGLGLAIDYSLLFVRRFQDEIADEDFSVEDAIVRTMATAGRAVFFSGTAVAIGLAVVLVVPVPFIRSLGVAGVVVPLVAMVVAFTMQPAVLAVLGRRAVRTVRAPTLEKKAHGVERQTWSWLARTVMRRPRIVASGAALVLVALAVPTYWLQLTPGSLSGLPSGIPSARGLTLMTDRVGPGAVTPIDVVLDGGAPGRARTPASTAATLRLARGLIQDPEVFVVAIGSKPPYVDGSGRYSHMLVVTRHAFGAGETQQLVQRLRRLIPATRFPPGFQIWTGGAPAQGVDFLSRVYGAFPWLIMVVLVLGYLVLLRAFRSVILPLVAVLLDIISVAASYGLLVVVFQFGVGVPLLDLYRAPQIEGWIPVLLFATLFGLSMDYEVFLVTRMREAWDGGVDNAAAVTYGIERTGRIVTAAAMIMVVSFSGLMAGRVAGLQELGAGLALGVLLDVTVVRILLMPSLMILLGHWCWWLPASLARILHVEASPLRERERRGLSNGAEVITSQP